jgi:excinuclease UvrABC ATPase subunit
LPVEDTAAGGSANKSLNETHERVLFSEKFACPVSGFTISEIEPRLFSFNNPAGACPTCDGLGAQQKIDANLIVPEPERTLRDGAIAPWAKSRPRPITTRRWKRSASTSASSSPPAGTTCTEEVQDVILNGTGREDRVPLCRWRCAPTPRTRISKASSPISSAAGRKPTAPGRARRSSATCRPRPARPATAFA